MKRKLILQGNNSYTVTLPIKWVKEYNLAPGAEIDVDVDDNRVIVQAEMQYKKSSITLDMKGETESYLRTVISNAYRIGYDIIEVKFENNSQLKHIRATVKNNLLGFDLLNEVKNTCMIENIAEPSGDQFNAIFDKMFIMVSHLFSETEKAFKKQSDYEHIQEITNKLTEYDNFCRRAISKKRFIEKNSQFYWLLFSYVLHVGREIFILNKTLKAKNITATKETFELLKKTAELFSLLQKSYMKRSTKFLDSIHALEKEIIYEYGYKALNKNSKDHILVHHILSIARNTYLANSPLCGLLF
jgi:phosphate uptake regulator